MKNLKCILKKKKLSFFKLKVSFQLSLIQKNCLKIFKQDQNRLKTFAWPNQVSEGKSFESI